ncbi:MAG: peptide deformylase [Tatlockia sp.]|nr:peptide deformylase [Tatlockia sp.]
MALNIVTIEQPEYRRVLKEPAEKVLFPLNKEDRELISSMKVKLKDLGGVGLAAPQVNSSKQIIAIYIPDEARLLRDNVEKSYLMHILINPSYEPVKQSETLYDFEACYSVSSKAGKVPRFKEIKLSYYNEVGQYHEQIERGFYARVLQHEIDHLNGVLIIDRLTPDCVQGTMEEMMALRRAELTEDKKVLYDSLMAKKQKK